MEIIWASSTRKDESALHNIEIVIKRTGKQTHKQKRRMQTHPAFGCSGSRGRCSAEAQPVKSVSGSTRKSLVETALEAGSDMGGHFFTESARCQQQRVPQKGGRPGAGTQAFLMVPRRPGGLRHAMQSLLPGLRKKRFRREGDATGLLPSHPPCGHTLRAAGHCAPEGRQRTGCALARTR